MIIGNKEFRKSYICNGYIECDCLIHFRTEVSLIILTVL